MEEVEKRKKVQQQVARDLEDLFSDIPDEVICSIIEHLNDGSDILLFLRSAW